MLKDWVLARSKQSSSCGSSWGGKNRLGFEVKRSLMFQVKRDSILQGLEDPGDTSFWAKLGCLLDIL